MNPTVAYRSNLMCRDYTPCFPHAREMDPAVYRNPQGHTVLCDPEIFPRCGYMTHDEGAVLANIVRRVEESRGVRRRWLEIGSHTGWSGAHIAPSCIGLVAVEPEFLHSVYNQTGSPAVFAGRFVDNMRRCGLPDDRVVMVPKKFEDAHADLLEEALTGSVFAGAFIDGEHEAPYPENDAKMAVQLLDTEYPVAVVFHDVLAPSVQAGVQVFIDAGFRWRLYYTPQLMAVCWRDGAKNKMPDMPVHRRDPSFDWDAWVGGPVRMNLDLRTQS